MAELFARYVILNASLLFGHFKCFFLEKTISGIFTGYYLAEVCL